MTKKLNSLECKIRVLRDVPLSAIVFDRHRQSKLLIHFFVWMNSILRSVF